MATLRRLLALTLGACCLGTVPFAAAAGGSALLAVEGLPSDIKDAYGPLGYEEREAEAPSRRLTGGLIAAGFCVAGFYWLVRRRRRLKQRGRAAGAAILPLPDEQSLALEPGEFYAHLMAVARAAVEQGSGMAASAMTPRELAMHDPMPSWTGHGAREDFRQRWQGLCSRAEAAEYAAARPGEAHRRADLEFVTGLIGRVRKRAAPKERSDAV